ncbi:MAG: diphthine--ammonia ligase [Candidatus Omnitrophica bacterium]|nr:diphthine--ammonia ligase [Candidatus Omnitrophota bacterium]
MKAFISWSGGKEASLSCYKAMQDRNIEVACLLNMTSEDGRLSRSHGVDSRLLKKQAEAMEIPILQRKAAWQTYEEEFKKAVSLLKRDGVEAGVFGDIDFQEHRDWVERVCGEVGIRPILPLWQRKREELITEFIKTGFKAIVVATQASYLGKEWLGREIDEKFVKDLKSVEGVDLCGEKGEYHSFVYDGPIFKKRVGFEIGKKVLKDERWLLEAASLKKKKIVSLAPSNTEIVFALGEGDKLVGVTECCDYPKEAKRIEKIGGFATPDIDKIASVSPNLVLATDFNFHLKVIPQLKDKAIPVYAIETKTILDAPQAISFVGELIGCREKASRLAGEIQKRVEEIQKKINLLDRKPRVCYVCSHNPLCVALKSCTVNKLIDAAGGSNIMQYIDMDNIDDLLEAIIEKNPEVIITTKGHKETVNLLSYVKNHPRFRETDAYSNNRVYQIRADLVCRPGPRAVEGLKALAKFIHPEIFGDI